MPNLLPLHVLAAVLLIGATNPDDATNPEAVAMLLARRIERTNTDRSPTALFVKPLAVS